MLLSVIGKDVNLGVSLKVCVQCSKCGNFPFPK